MKTISVTLDKASIENAIKELNDYKKWIITKTEQLEKRIAELGYKEASVRFAGVVVDSDTGNDTDVQLRRTAEGYQIEASGHEVWFIEFGTGVHYNDGSYPLPKPAGVGGIGTYGKGRGKRQAWGWYDASGELHKTHGIKAAMPMYFAVNEMEKQLLTIAKEVFDT